MDIDADHNINRYYILHSYCTNIQYGCMPTYTYLYIYEYIGISMANYFIIVIATSRQYSMAKLMNFAFVNIYAV